MSAPKNIWMLGKTIAGVNHWIGVKGGMFRWLDDKDRALQLVRSRDADALFEVIGDAERIEWCYGTSVDEDPA